MSALNPHPGTEVPIDEDHRFGRMSKVRETATIASTGNTFELAAAASSPEPFGHRRARRHMARV
jgi:hypothetical protein